MNTIMCSVIIRSFNEENHIGRLIDGIKKQTIFEAIEIILVDSGSTDSTVKIAECKGATIISIKPKDFSFGRALNIGCKIAKGKYLLFASAHVYPVYNTWIEKMLKPFEDESVALVYGRQIGNEKTKFSEHQIFKKWFPKDSNYDQGTPFCNNANAVIRKELWEQQAYDEKLTGLEDLDWANKIQRKGLRVIYEAHAPVVHVHDETFNKVKNRYKREAIALKKIFPNQKISFFDFVRLSIGNIISDSVYALKEKDFLSNFSGIVQFRFMQFWGTYQGFKQKGDVNNELKRRFYYPNNFKSDQSTIHEIGEKILYPEYELQH
jgi:rhamnosyltransferase